MAEQPPARGTASNKAAAALSVRIESSLYRTITLIREFEEQVHRSSLEGLVHGTTHLCSGQEAVCGCRQVAPRGRLRQSSVTPIADTASAWPGAWTSKPRSLSCSDAILAFAADLAARCTDIDRGLIQQQSGSN
jgi:hypothetical protein